MHADILDADEMTYDGPTGEPAGRRKPNWPLALLAVAALAVLAVVIVWPSDRDAGQTTPTAAVGTNGQAASAEAIVGEPVSSAAELGPLTRAVANAWLRDDVRDLGTVVDPAVVRAADTSGDVTVEGSPRMIAGAGQGSAWRVRLSDRSVMTIVYVRADDNQVGWRAIVVECEELPR